MAKHKGFSLVELVATIVIIGIIAVTVLPRFSGRGGVAEYALRDQLVALLQQAQQRAMFDHSGACYSLNINAGAAQVQRNAALVNTEAQIAFTGDYTGLSVTPTTIYFDSLGNVLTGGASCALSSIPAGTTTLTVSGSVNVDLVVYSTGYVARS